MLFSWRNSACLRREREIGAVNGLEGGKGGPRKLYERVYDCASVAAR